MSGLLAGLLLALFAIDATAAPAKQIDAYLFWAIGCPHCEPWPLV